MANFHRPGRVVRAIGESAPAGTTQAPSREALAQEPVLDCSEIQGNILGGFNKDYQMLLFLRIEDRQRTREWIAGIQARIATLEEVLAFKRLYQAVRGRRGRNMGTVQSTWINIAFSFPGLCALTGSDAGFREAAFREGMCNRSKLLGDPMDARAPGSCRNWLIGGPGNEPDILLLVASDSRDKLHDEVHGIKAGLHGGLTVMLEQRGEAPAPPMSAHEQFGFRDGISQPGVRGRVSDLPEDFLTMRENPAEPNQGKPGQELVWPGEFVFGYPRQDPRDKVSPGLTADAGPDWARNGSFLVVRRFRQEVQMFRAFLVSAAAELNARHPACAGMTPGKLASKLMGRWYSGAPVLRAPDVDNPNLPLDSCADNNFAFVRPSTAVVGGRSDQCRDNVFPRSWGDDLGLVCPYAAHIRKAYPRDDLLRFGTEAEVQTHRLIRRGFPFFEPKPAPGERGLLFLAYMTSFERQFEHIIRYWMNNPDFREAGSGYDPIVGQNNVSGDRVRTFALRVRYTNGEVIKIDLPLPTDWVIPTGGGYFFSPSISALRYLA